MNIFLLMIAAFIVFGMAMSFNKSKLKKALAVCYGDLNGILPNFKPDKIYTNPDGLSMIELDSNLRKVLLAHKLPNVKPSLFGIIPSPLIASRSASLTDILKCEMFVDGQMVSSKSAGGALAGGLLFGTTGAVVGSNTGKTTYSKEVRSVTLKLILNNITDPTCELLFFEKGMSSGSPVPAQQECQNWVDTLFVAISQNGKAE